MFSIRHTDGSSERNPSFDSLSDLYDELLVADEEHGDVSLTHESGWFLAAYRGGRLILEHYDDGGGRHVFPVSKERVLSLWQQLAEGDIDGVIKAEPWVPGYGG